jgi:PmbA protein
MKRKLLDLNSPETVGTIAAQRTLRKLGGRPIGMQRVPVVFESGLARALLDDIAEAVFGESIVKKASFLAGQLGKRIASECLTVVDDGRIPGGLGSRPFDAEGVATRRTVIINGGVLESYLLNTFSSKKLGLNSTGNASRGLVGPPDVGTGNLYVESGLHPPEKIIGSVAKGLLITDLTGLGVNIVTGAYSKAVSGMWIENGEITFPVQGITMAGNLLEMLNSIEMVGNDLQFRGSLGSPTLLIGSMLIGT